MTVLLDNRGRLKETWYDGDFLFVPIEIGNNVFEYTLYVLPGRTSTGRLSARLVSFWINELRKKVQHCSASIEWRRNIIPYASRYGAPPRNFGLLFVRIAVAQWGEGLNITFDTEYTDVPEYIPSDKSQLLCFGGNKKERKEPRHTEQSLPNPSEKE